MVGLLKFYKLLPRLVLGAVFMLGLLLLLFYHPLSTIVRTRTLPELVGFFDSKYWPLHFLGALSFSMIGLMVLRMLFTAVEQTVKYVFTRVKWHPYKNLTKSIGATMAGYLAVHQPYIQAYFAQYNSAIPQDASAPIDVKAIAAEQKKLIERLIKNDHELLADIAYYHTLTQEQERIEDRYEDVRAIGYFVLSLCVWGAVFLVHLHHPASFFDKFLLPAIMLFALLGIVHFYFCFVGQEKNHIAKSLIYLLFSSLSLGGTASISDQSTRPY